MAMTVRDMQKAHEYAEGHQVRVLRDLCLLFATGTSLVSVLEHARNSGYEAHEDEQTSLTRRGEPDVTIQEHARLTLSLSSYADTSKMEWTWQADEAIWLAEGDDCSIRPSLDGRAVIVMEASGEYSGVIITPHGSEYRFPEGTFR